MAIKNREITVQYTAWNTSTNTGQTGDDGNHTLQVVKSGVDTPATNSPAEVDAVTVPGVYSITLTAAEMNDNFVTFGGVSSTGNVVIIPLHMPTEREPEGTGDYEVTLTIRDTGGNPISGVSVWVNTSNDRSSSVAGTRLTNDSGEVVFYLNYTTYYIFCHKNLYTFNAANFTASAGFVDFTKDIGVLSSVGEDSNYIDSFITRSVDLVRLHLEEPVINAKYDDTQIIEHLERSYIHCLSEKNRNSLTPIVSRFNITINATDTEYILPYNIASVVAIYDGTDLNGLKIFYSSRSEYNTLGRRVWVEGNILKLQDVGMLNPSHTLTVEYIPSGTPRIHNGTCTINADGTEVTFGSLPHKGILDTHVNAYVGSILRILGASGTTITGDMLQERQITAYNNVTRTATISPPLNPVPTTDDGYIYYEVAPDILKGMDSVVALHTIYQLAGVEGKQQKLYAARKNYQESLRNVRLTAFYSRLDEASTVRADNFDNRHYPWG